MKKPTRTQKDAVRKLVEKLQTQLLLAEWKVEVDFEDKIVEDETTYTFAEIKPLPEYREASLSIFGSFWMMKNVKNRHDVLLHELIHLVVNPLAEAGENNHKDDMNKLAEAEERVVSHIAHILEKRKP